MNRNMRKMYTEQEIIDLIKKNVPTLKELIPEDLQVTLDTTKSQDYTIISLDTAIPSLIGKAVWMVIEYVTLPCIVDSDGTIFAFMWNGFVQETAIQKLLYID